MRLIIHDLSQEQAEKILPEGQSIQRISDNGKIKNCIGCFGCWIKTPAECVIKDGYAHIGELLSKCDELTMISQCFYGGFSPFVKNVLDRSISYSHPYFTFRNEEMHHRRRYENHFHMNVYFYGETITKKERDTAQKLVKANAVNLDCHAGAVVFASKAEELGGRL